MERVYYRQVENYTNGYKETGLVYFEMIGNTTAKVMSKDTDVCLGWVDSSVFLGSKKDRLFERV